MSEPKIDIPLAIVNACDNGIVLRFQKNGDDLCLSGTKAENVISQNYALSTLLIILQEQFGIDFATVINNVVEREKIIHA